MPSLRRFTVARLLRLVGSLGSTEAFWRNNGALSFSILPTRGMGLWRGQYHGLHLGWRAPILIDQEGGRVQRLTRRNGHIYFPSAHSVGRNPSFATEESAVRLYTGMAEQLAQAGINLNFGPVVDLNTNPSNPVIGARNRSFGADPNIVTARARANTVGLRSFSAIGRARMHRAPVWHARCARRRALGPQRGHRRLELFETMRVSDRPLLDWDRSPPQMGAGVQQEQPDPLTRTSRQHARRRLLEGAVERDTRWHRLRRAQRAQVEHVQAGIRSRWVPRGVELALDDGVFAIDARRANGG